MATEAPDLAVQTRLCSTVTATSLAAGTNCLLGRPRPEASFGDRSVWVYVLASRDTLCLGTSTSVQQTTVQVVTRCDTGDRVNGIALARDCLAALDYPTISGYVGCQIQQADPYDTGQDPEGRHRWAFEVVLTAVS